MISSEHFNLDTLNFNGGEIQVKVTNTQLNDVTIQAHLQSSNDIMTLLLTTDALRRQNVENIYVQIPYLPYARQDRICSFGEALSLRVFADLINSQNYVGVEVWDAHSDVAGALINNMINIPAIQFIAQIGFNPKNTVLVSPDAGALKKTFEAAKTFNCKMLQASKHRNVNTGEIYATEIHGVLHHNIRYLIIDDICDGGRTFIELAKEIKKSGAIVDLYVTHGIFSKGFTIFEGLIDNIYCANAWPGTYPTNFHKV